MLPRLIIFGSNFTLLFSYSFMCDIIVSYFDSMFATNVSFSASEKVSFNCDKVLLNDCSNLMSITLDTLRNKKYSSSIVTFQVKRKC